MSEVGRPDSLVRGLAVFAGAICGVVMMVHPDLTPVFVVVVFVLAMIAAHYVARP